MNKLEKWFVEYYDSMDPVKGYNGREGGPKLGAKMNAAFKERLILYYSEPANAKKNQIGIKRAYEERPELREMAREQMRKRTAEGKNRAFVESSRRAKPVLCVETGEMFPSVKAAERATGFSGVRKACSGVRSLSGGYHWKWV